MLEQPRGDAAKRVYNDGWEDWGNNLTLPVVEGDAPYDEAYAL